MKLEKYLNNLFKNSKKASKKNSIYSKVKDTEDFFHIKDIKEDYILLKNDKVVVTYEITQSVSNFLDEYQMKKIAIKNTEAFSKIDIPYSFLSLVKSKDMSIYTDYLTSLMNTAENPFKENALYKLREYINQKVSQNDFSSRSFYLIFSDEESNLREFSTKLNYIKKELKDSNIIIRKLNKQEQIDVLYIYFNPDTNLVDSYDINEYTVFFA